MTVEHTLPAGQRTRAEEAPTEPAAVRRPSLRRRILKEKWTYLFLLPGVLYFVVFHYVPLLGNVVAFQDFSPFRGIFGSDWVGLENFRTIVRDPEVMRALTNTLII